MNKWWLHILIWMMGLSLFASCDGVFDDRGEVAPGEKVHMAVRFSVNSEWGSGQGGPGWLSGRSIDNPGTDTQEGTTMGYVPQDIWVIQYGGTADDAPLVGLPRYVELSSGATIQAVACSRVNTLVFVANTHDPNIDWGNISTLGQIKQVGKVIAGEADCYGNNMDRVKDLILSGRYEGLINTGALSIELFRNIARIDFTVNNVAGSAMTLKTIQLCNVPKIFCYTSGFVSRESIIANGVDYFDYPAENVADAATPGHQQSFTFYMPSNERGVNPASIDKKTKPLHAPHYSSFLRVVAVNADNRAYAYYIYPGANMVNDYNILANHHYRIELSINSSGDASTDGRVENYGQVDLGSANSYILNPPAEGTSGRVFTFPIERLNEFWLATDTDLVIAQGDGWTAELIWQDVSHSDFIRFIDLSTGNLSQTMSGNGPAQRIAVIIGPAVQGNALIGIKKDGHDVGYVWSWHLWVTSYDPSHRAIPVGGQYVYQVSNGAVHRYVGSGWTNISAGRYRNGYVMDRNLGARNSGFSAVGALYYQYGRKDPLPCIGHGNELYDILGQPLEPNDPRNATTMNKNAGAGVTLAQGVHNPTFFYYKVASQSYGDWSSEGKPASHMWNNLVEGTHLKSIFDPCPQGWELLNRTAWEDFKYSPFTPSLSTVLDPGRDPRLAWDYKGENGLRYWPKNLDVTESVYYPALGYRDVSSGDILGLGDAANCWTHAAYDGVRAFSLASYQDKLNISTHNYRGYGLPGRCVQM